MEILISNELANRIWLFDLPYLTPIAVDSVYILTYFGFNPDNFQINIIILSVMSFFFIFISGLSIQFFAYEKR
jgi:hypothetical protein